MNLILIHYFETDYCPDQQEFPVVYPSIEGLKEGIAMALLDYKKRIDNHKVAVVEHFAKMSQLDTSAYDAATKTYWDLVFQGNEVGKTFEEKFDLEEKIKSARKEANEEYAKLPALPARPDNYLFTIGDARICADEETNMASFEIYTLDEWFTMRKATPVFLKQ